MCVFVLYVCVCVYVCVHAYVFESNESNLTFETCMTVRRSEPTYDDCSIVLRAELRGDVGLLGCRMI